MARVYTHVVAFRVTAAEHRRLQRLRATFPDAQWGEMFRWLMDQNGVVDAISARIAEEGPAPAVGAMDLSLPVGDR